MDSVTGIYFEGFFLRAFSHFVAWLLKHTDIGSSSIGISLSQPIYSYYQPLFGVTPPLWENIKHSLPHTYMFVVICDLAGSTKIWASSGEREPVLQSCWPFPRRCLHQLYTLNIFV